MLSCQIQSSNSLLSSNEVTGGEQGDKELVEMLSVLSSAVEGHSALSVFDELNNGQRS